jgi:MFS family permease
MTPTHVEPGELAPGSADAWPRPAYSWYVVGILTFAYTVSFIDRQILNLLVEPIRHDLGINDTQISLLQGLAFAIFYSLMGIPIAWLADRSNRRNVIVVGMVLWCMMTAACGLSRNFLQLFLARIGVGVGEAALSPPAYSIIADYFPPHRLARATGTYAFGVYAGAGIAMLAGGAVISMISDAKTVVLPVLGSFRPWQLTFLVVGLPGLLVAALMMTVREPVRRDSRPVTAGGRAKPTIAELLAFLKSRKSTITAICIGFSFVGMVIIAILSWTPTLFIRIHGWTAGEIGLAYGLILLLLGTSGSVMGGVIADWFYRRGRKDATLRTALYASLLALPLAIAMPLVGNAWLAIALLAPVTFLLSAPVGLSAAAIQLMTPNHLRAQVTAVYLLVVALIGTGFGPMVVALPTDYLFRDPQAVGRSLALATLVLIPLGAISLWYGCRAFRVILGPPGEEAVMNQHAPDDAG